MMVSGLTLRQNGNCPRGTWLSLDWRGLNFSCYQREASEAFGCRTESPGCPEDPCGCAYLDAAGTCNSRFGLIIPVPPAPNHICG